MDTTIPQNIEYLVMGLAVTGVVMLIFLGSMFARYRSLKQDVTLIRELSEEN